MSTEGITLDQLRSTGVDEGISLTDLRKGVVPTQQSDAANVRQASQEYGGAATDFAKRTFNVLKDAMPSYEERANPLEELKSEAKKAVGLGKAFVGGIVSLGQLADQGLSGIAAWRNQMAGGTFEGGVEWAKKRQDQALPLVMKIAHINLAPENEQDKQMSDLLMLLPEGVTAAGDTVFEKTGSSLAGAGTQALGTLLMFKPSIATKLVANIPKKAFRKAAMEDPAAVENIAEHVAEADPKAAEEIRKTAKEVSGLGLDELRKAGEEAAKKNPSKLPEKWDFVEDTGKPSEEPTPPKPAVRREQLSDVDLILRETAAWDAKYKGKGGKYVGDLENARSGYTAEQYEAATEAAPIFDRFHDHLELPSTGALDPRRVIDYKDPDGNVATTLNEIAKSVDSPELTQLVKAVSPFVKDVKLFFVHPDHPVLEKNYGHYDSVERAVVLSLDRDLVQSPFAILSLLHEGVHAAVYDYMTRFPKSPETMEMRSLMAEAKVRARRIQRDEGRIPGKNLYDKLYGMTNPHEFVAEALSNPQFQRFLLKSERYATPSWKGKRLLNQLGVVIKKMLGMPLHSSALLDNIIGNFQETARAAQLERQGMGAPAAAKKPKAELPPDELSGRRAVKEDPTKALRGIKMEDPSLASNIRRAEIEAAAKGETKRNLTPEEANQAYISEQKRQTESERLKQDGKNLSEEEKQRILDWTAQQSWGRKQEGNVPTDKWSVLPEEMSQVSSELNKSATEVAADKWGVRPTIYTSGGISIPRKEILAMTRIGWKWARKVPGFVYAEGKLRGYMKELAHNIAPETLGKKAEQTAAVVAESIAKWKALNAQQAGKSAARRKFWNENSNQIDTFIENYEKGTPMKGPFEDFRQGYKGWMEILAAEDKAKGIDYEPLDNYMTHLFKEKEAVADYLKQKYGSKFGDPYFMKDRTGKTYAELKKRGFTPRFTNPEDIMVARQYASNIAHARIEMFEELANIGLAKRVRYTATGKVAEGPPKGWPERTWRSPNGKKYYVSEESAAILKNAFETKSLWNMEGTLAGDAYRTGMAIKNKIVPIRLFGFFHAAHVGLLINNAAAFTRVGKMLLAENVSPKLFAKELASGALPLSGVWNRSANRVLQAYWGKVPPEKLTAGERQLMSYMQEGGLVPGMAEQDRGTAIARFRDAVQQGKKGQSVFQLPFAAIEALQYPMFHIWIPTLKIAAYARDVAVAMHLNPELANDHAARVQTFAKIRKSVDNRFGEMNYDTLFWNRMVKDVAVLNTLSLGWQMGFIREYGGGLIVDPAKAVWKDASLKEIAKQGGVDRTLFALSYVGGALLLAGVMTYAFTGQMPEGQDWFYPRIGGTDAEGKPKRVNTPYFTREFAAIYSHMQKEGVVPGLTHLVTNKASGVIGLTGAIAGGVDSLDREVRDPNAPAYKQLEQTLAFVFRDVAPISAESVRQGATKKEQALSFAGFTNAPKYATETPLEAAISSTFQKYYGAKLTPYDRAAYSDDARKLRRMLEQDSPEYDNQLTQMEQKYDLTPAESRKLERNLARGTSAFLQMFSRLEWKQQKKILDEHWNEMTPDEQDDFLKRSNKEHLRNNYEPPEKR